MKRKYSNAIIAGAVFAAVILVHSFNVMAYKEEEAAEKIYKTDRTLIKEVLANQETTHALLNEIKAILQKTQ